MIRPARAWAFFLISFAVGLALVAAGTLVRFNQYSPIPTATLKQGEHIDVGGWRFTINVPLGVVAVPSSLAGEGRDTFGRRIDQEGATWLYAEVKAEPLPSLDFEKASCSLELRIGRDRFEDKIYLTQSSEPFCTGKEAEVGKIQRVGTHFQIPASRLREHPYVVLTVPGFPAKAIALESGF